MLSIFSRERLLYVAMSVFVAWHTFAMVSGPNGSTTAQSFRVVTQPYLSLFRLESTWAFFAPSVGKHTQFRYVIEDENGVEHTFTPIEELNWISPSDYWFRNWYYGIIESPELHGDFFATTFCRKHAALNPVSITLVVVQELDFSPEDQLRGKHPLDPEFTSVDVLMTVACPHEPYPSARKE